MRRYETLALALSFTLVLLPFAVASEPAAGTVIPAGSKVFVATMDDGFDTYLRDALRAKKVPLEVVTDRKLADFEITGHSDSQKASAAKKIILGSWHSNEQASIAVANVNSGIVAFAFSAHKENSAHG